MNARTDETDVAPFSDGALDGRRVQTLARATEHAVEGAMVDVPMTRLRQLTGLDCSPMVKQRGGIAFDEARPLAFERLSRVEQVHADQPIEECGRHASGSGGRRTSG